MTTDSKIDPEGRISGFAVLVAATKARMDVNTPTGVHNAHSDPPSEADEPVPKPMRHQIHSAVEKLELAESPEWRKWAVKLDETHHDQVARLSRWTEWFIKRMSFNKIDKGHQIVVVGNPGCGKTHALRRIKRWVESHRTDLYIVGHWPAPPQVCAVDWAKLMEQKEDWVWEDAQTEARAAGVVLIDDAGSEVDKFKTGLGTSRLRQMLSICEKKWLFMTTNVPREEWASVYDQRVADRLSAAHYLDMTGVPSYRPKLKGTA